MTRCASAVIFGKFWPLHVGHLRLIGEAMAQAERVLVLVDDGEEDVPSAVRAGWVQESFPAAEVETAPDLCGHDSEDCTEECSANYAAWLLANHGEVESVFSAEPYGDRLAFHLGATSVCLDRSELPAAGREIRANLARHWGLLAPPARAWYCRRVVVLGAESTGTTTLAADLAERLGTIWVPEFGRQFTGGHGRDHRWVSEDFELIARRQAEMEDDAARRSAPVLVCDTDVLATTIWHERYVGTRSAVVEAMARARRPHLYVLTSDDICFVQDGMRDGAHLRGWMTERFRRVLADSATPWLEVRGSRDDRVEQVTRTMREHLGEAWLDCVSTSAKLAPSSGRES